MNKILLLEDRPDRMRQMLNNGDIMPDNVDIISDMEEIGSFLEEMEIRITDYEIIIVHRSALTQHADNGFYNTLVAECREIDKPLVVFTGGIGQSIYSNDGPILLMNSKNFYSANLIPFVNLANDGKRPSLLYLVSGEIWELSELMLDRHNSTYNEQPSSNFEKISSKINLKIEEL
ncbi:MAG: hypothetical protein V3V14_11530 [Saprospiraceae bacterium]